MDLFRLEVLKKKKIPVAVLSAFVLIFIVFRPGCSSEKTVKPRLGPVTESIYGLGTVKTDKSYNVRFGMNTVIRKLYVREGDIVNAGSPLVMNDSSLTARSPFAGIVTSVSYLEGELAPSGQAIVAVSGSGSMYIRVSLDQDSIILVKKGQAVEISFEKKRDEKISGLVSSVYMADDEFLVRIDAEAMPGWVLPGMTCDTAILVSKNENAIMIPYEAIIDKSVNIIRKGSRMQVKAEFKSVDEKWAEITNGSIQPDDIIIITEKNTGPRNEK